MITFLLYVFSPSILNNEKCDSDKNNSAKALSQKFQLVTHRTEAEKGIIITNHSLCVSHCFWCIPQPLWTKKIT